MKGSNGPLGFALPLGNTGIIEVFNGTAGELENPGCPQ